MIIHKYARVWGWLIIKICGVQVTLGGSEQIEQGRPYILMANHQGAFDIFALLAYLPVDFKWVAREEIFRIPIIGWAMKAAGYISIDRQGRKKAIQSIEKAVAKIQEGTSVLVFPEGTRSPDGRIHAFKKGGFTLAVKAGVPIIPISIRGSREVLPRGSLTVSSGRIDIIVGQPIRTDNRGLAARHALMGDVRQAIENGFRG